MAVVIAISKAMTKMDIDAAVVDSSSSSSSSSSSLSSSSSSSSSHDRDDRVSPLYTSGPLYYYPQTGFYAFTNPPTGNPVGTDTANQTSGLLASPAFPNTTIYVVGGMIQGPVFRYFPSPEAFENNFVEYYDKWVGSDDLLDILYANLTPSLLPVTSGILFDEYNPSKSKLHYTLENVGAAIGSKFPFMQAYSYSSESGDTPWRVMSYLNNAFLKALKGDDYLFDMTVSFTYVNNHSFSMMVITYIMAMFVFPIMFTFVFPVFVQNIVFERQQKLFQVMSMMGLRNSTYVLANHLFFVFIYAILAIVMVVMGCAAQLPFFIEETGRMILLIALYGLALVSMAFFFAAFFWKAKTSTIVSYIFVLIGPMVGSVLELFVFQGLKTPPLPYIFFPPFAFVHGLFCIFLKMNSQQGGNYEHLITFSKYSQFSQVLVALFVESIVLFLAGVYLGNVIPKEYGVSYSPFYPFTDSYKFIKSFFVKTPTATVEPVSLEPISQDSMIGISEETDDVIEEDSDCVAEREKANSGNNYLLKSVNLKKIYKSGGRTKEALVNFCLTSTEGEILGLLGPNGAGKTTFIHIIGGMYTASSGEAYINGLPISTQMDKIYEQLGFCPQHDILYDDLTILQHLRFYCELKGIFNTKEERDEHIHSLLVKSKLEEHKEKRIHQLSGGMKRRVSITISLLGNNKLVLLDEPTTGLDPDSRRAVWDIIQEVRHDKTILITTHNMEEADVLCNKIAIVASGRLQCVGSPMYLKNRFGNGFKLTIVPVAESYHYSMNEMVANHFPESQTQEPINNELSYLIPKGSDISTIFETMTRRKEELGIKEWGISQTSLEEVFMKMVESEEEFLFRGIGLKELCVDSPLSLSIVNAQINAVVHGRHVLPVSANLLAIESPTSPPVTDQAAKESIVAGFYGNLMERKLDIESTNLKLQKKKTKSIQKVCLECVCRESNSDRFRGREPFYHWTTHAIDVIKSKILKLHKEFLEFSKFQNWRRFITSI
eukprot:gene18808-22503_t